MSVKRSGFGLVEVLVTASVAAVALVGTMAMMRSQGRAQRHIAALGGAADLGHALDLLLRNPQCASLGAGSFSNAGASPVSVTVTGTTYALALDTMRFPTGAVAITTGADVIIRQMIHPHTLAELAFVALGGEGPTGGGFQYPFRMTARFTSPQGSAPPQPLTKFLRIHTDAARRVIGACSGGPASSGPAHASLYRSGEFNGLASVGVWYNLPFDGETSKSRVTHNVATSPHLVIIEEPGTYDVSYTVSFHNGGAGSGYARLLKNGAEVPGSVGSVGLTGWSGAVSFRTVIDLATNDTISVAVGKNYGNVRVNYWAASPDAPPASTPSTAALTLVKMP